MSASEQACGALQARILEARESGAKCMPVGANSKSQWDVSDGRWPLATLDLDEVRAYEPTELVLTAGAGVRLRDLKTLLASEGQMLGFEAFNAEDATLGGAVASGIAGPARPFRGAIRDFVLGVRVLNGRAERLGFGGQVIKNVAGYDASRLLAASWGTLGVMLEVSLRVVPRPETEVGIALECGVDEALKRMCALARSACPLSGAAYVDDVLHLRVAGVASSVQAAMRQIGAGEMDAWQEFWSSLADARHEIFSSPTPVYRLSVPPATPHFAVPGRWLIDWGGALRWLATDVPTSEWLASVTSAGGQMLPWPPKRGDMASCWRCRNRRFAGAHS